MGKTHLTLGLFMVAVVAFVACSAPVKGLFPPAEGEPTRVIYLVSHGWHAGIVVERADIPQDVWPEQGDFPESDYLEVGWGDRDFYQTSQPHWGLVLKAALWPTSSVLHVTGFSALVSAYFPDSEIVRIELSSPGFERLCRYIANSYSRDASGHAVVLGSGLYGKSHFYLSREFYHGFKTCNVWTARALRAAGCPLTPAFTIRVESLMSQARGFGTDPAQ